MGSIPTNSISIVKFKFYFDYQIFNLIGGETNMCNIPKNCLSCGFETSCDSGMNMIGCKYYGLFQKEKISMMDRIKNYFGKFFMK